MTKGQTNNPNGRPKGKPNKVTREVREVIKAVLEERVERIPALLDTLTPKEELEMIVKLTAFIVPKPITAEDNGDDWDKDVTFD